MSLTSGKQILLASAAEGRPYTTAQRSVRFNSADSAYLSRTPASAGNRKTWTISLWVKRSKLGVLQSFTSSANDSVWLFDASDKLCFYDAGAYRRVSTQVFRDASAWYHLVLVVDTPNSTAQNRARAYVNGTEITTWDTNTTITQNRDTTWNDALAHQIGANNSTQYSDLYVALFHNIDGQALTPSSFGKTDTTTGQWIPLSYPGAYGTNGFFLDFLDNSAATAAALGKDSSGNGNNFTPNNLSVSAGSGNDSLRDHPVSAGTSTGLGGEVSGNYCTWNPLNSSTYTFANGNLEATGYAGNSQMVSTIGVSSGKWYCEISLSGSGGTSNAGIGISKGEQGTYPGQLSTSYGYFGSASKINAGSVTSYGATYTYGDIIGIALDMDAGTCTMYKNGSSQGQLASGLSGTYFIAVRNSSNAGDKTIANFGQRAFAYTAPSGFSPLVDTLLTPPTIAKPNTVMDVKLWNGNGTTTGDTQTISGLGFSPDLVWVKERSSTAWHVLCDTVRGANKTIYSNDTYQEESLSNVFNAFNSDGFQVAYNSSYTNVFTNRTSQTYAGWCWDAGSSAASTNNNGSIQSTVKANTTSGFSICSFTWSPTGNGTFGHGLGAVPEFAIFKIRNITDNWWVYHKSIGNTNYLNLNTTGASTASSQLWNNTTPTSSVMTLGTNWAGNVIGYLWTPVAGYSAFGSYTGNGSSDGPFVYTGFRPRWVLIKTTNDAAESWRIWDSARSTYNAANSQLFPNNTNAEITNIAYDCDFLSNGFKLRTSNADFNGSADTVIYACFAESPFQYARAR